jgi:hypothetical protein
LRGEVVRTWKACAGGSLLEISTTWLTPDGVASVVADSRSSDHETFIAKRVTALKHKQACCNKKTNNKQQEQGTTNKNKKQETRNNKTR